MARNFRERLALARGLMKRGELTTAESMLAAIVNDHPNFADVHNELGLLHHELGDFQKAAAAFGRALEINPAYTEAALNLAITWNDLGRYDDARRVCESAQQARDSRENSLHPAAAGRIANLHAEIADIYADLGRLKDAIRAYREALAVGPLFHDVRLRLANTLQLAGDKEAAVAELEQVVRDAPEQVNARVALGLAYFSAGRRDEAVACWREVVGRDPEHGRARMYLRVAGTQ